MSPEAPLPPVVLLSDFGTADGYVAAMKGVLATRAPGVPLIDATHEVPRGDPGAGARALERYWRLFPAGTVFLCVVDPGVGTRRRAIAVSAAGRFGVGPDNGLLRPLLEAPDARCVVLARQETPGAPSATFHGRDVFAPAAAHLAAGGRFDALGDPVDDPVRGPSAPAPRGEPGRAQGVVTGVDRFGNLATNLPGPWLRGAAWVEIGRHRVPVGRTYGDVAPGEGLALVGSDGLVEVAVRDGSAAQAFAVSPGTRVGLVPETA